MPKIKTAEEGYAMIVKGKYAYLTDESETKYKAMSDCMILEVAKETFHKAELSFVINKEAEFKDAFNNQYVVFLCMYNALIYIMINNFKLEYRIIELSNSENYVKSVVLTFRISYIFSCFTCSMLKMVEGGIVDKFRSKWWPQNNCPSSTTATELVFESTSGIFVVYGGFLVISLTCFIIEVLLIQGKKHTSNKVQSPPNDIKDISLIIVDI